jgi:hypothetical protein
MNTYKIPFRYGKSEKTQHAKVLKWLFLAVISICFDSTNAFADYVITPFSDQVWCSSSLPTAYNTVSFSITESRISRRRGFSVNQTNATLILGLSNASFQFNPGQGTVSVSGTGVTINSYSITSTNITVNLTTTSTNTSINKLSFNNIQVRCNGTGTGYVRRTGGTFRIDGDAGNPGANRSWGRLFSNSSSTLSSSTTTQVTTANVAFGSVNNRILRLALTITGGCGNLNASSFQFTTNGSTSPLTDITSAKLYYTGTSPTFSLNNLYGTTNNPNGTFTVSGNTTFASSGTYYFWLTYDISASAVNGHLVDATTSGVTLSGNFVSLTGNPAGSRTIITTTFYSIAGGNGNWNSTGNWSAISNTGASCNCVPTTNTIVFVAHPINLNTSISLTNLSVINGGNLTNSFGTLTVTNLLSTSGNGVFRAATSWNIQDILLTGTGNSGFQSGSLTTIPGVVNIGTGTTLTRTNSDITFSGSVSINGTLALSNMIGNFSGAGATIDGTGSITGTGSVSFTNDKTILDNSAITINPNLSIGSGAIISNYGEVSCFGNITGGNSSSTWLNLPTSVLGMYGSGSGSLLSTGTLDASAAPNLVKYSTSANQTIKPATYYNLSLANQGVKTLASNLVIGNDLTIDGSASLDVSTNNYSVNISGDINNLSSAAAGSIVYRTGTFTFDGITSLLGDFPFGFNNLVISQDAELTSSPAQIKVAGNFTNNGSFFNNSGEVNFIPSNALGGSNSASILGTRTTEFNNLTVSSGKTLTLYSGTTIIEGDLTNNGTLNHNNGKINFSGTSGITQNIGGSTASMTFSDLEFDNIGGSLNINNPVTILDSLLLTNGILFTPSSSITMGASGKITGYGDLNYVSGKLIQTYASASSKIFPVGKNGVYRPLTFAYQTLTGTSATAVEQFETALTGSLPSAAVLNNSRYWDISQTGGSSFTYFVTLDPTNDAIAGSVVMLRKQSGTIAAAATTTPNYTNASAYNSLTGTCSFTLGSSCSFTSASISVSQSNTTLCSGTVFSTSITGGGSNPQYQWRKNGVNIPSATGTTFTGSSLVAGDLISCILTSSSACAGNSPVTSAPVSFTINPQSTTWTGASDNNWNNASNWNNGLPGLNKPAVINSGTPQLSSSLDVYGISIGSGGSLQVSGTPTIRLYGNLSNDGIFNPGNSIIELNGCPGTSGVVHNLSSGNNTILPLASLTMNDVAGATLNTNATLKNELTLNSGLFTNNNRTFTFLSTASNTARVAPITGGSYAGNITMQRLAPGGATGWALFGSCVNNTTLADWYNNNTEIPMSGFPGVSYTVGGSNFISVYTYNESAPGVMNAAASYIVPTNVTNPIETGKGYMIYFGNGGTTTTDILFDVTGTFTRGNFSFPVTYTNTGAGIDNDGWNIVANPYPSAIDWNLLGRTNINDTYYMMNPDINNYVTYTTSTNVGTNGGTRFIASSQGFYVKANAANPSLTATESCKASAQPFFYRDNTAGNASLSISVQSASSKLADETVIRFDASASNQLDELDNLKLFPRGSYVSVYTQNANNDLSVNSLADLDLSTEIPVNLVATEAGNYQIKINGLSDFFTRYASLFASEVLVLQDENGHTLAEIGSEKEGRANLFLPQGVSRFTLRWASATVAGFAPAHNDNKLLVANDANGLYVCSFDAGNAQVKLFSAAGQEIENIQLGNIQTGTRHYIKTKTLSPGIYLLQFVQNGKQVTSKVRM